MRCEALFPAACCCCCIICCIASALRCFSESVIFSCGAGRRVPGSKKGRELAAFRGPPGRRRSTLTPGGVPLAVAYRKACRRASDCVHTGSFPTTGQGNRHLPAARPGTPRRSAAPKPTPGHPPQPPRSPAPHLEELVELPQLVVFSTQVRDDADRVHHQRRLVGLGVLGARVDQPSQLAKPGRMEKPAGGQRSLGLQGRGKGGRACA